MTPRGLVTLMLVMVLVLLLVMKIEGNSTPSEEYGNDASDVSLSSPNSNGTGGVSLTPKLNDENQVVGCSIRPWICNQGSFPPRYLCCEDRCVDVTLDGDNCGLCGIRCLFNWQCCNRLCLNTNIDPFNCGACGRTCPFGRFCIFGICAFERALPPSPLFPPLPPQQAQPPPLPIFPPLPPQQPQPQSPPPPLPIFPPLPSPQPQPQPQPTEME